MPLPAEVPRLPKLPFVLTDIVLLGAAAYIALTAPAPLGGPALIAVVILVALGAATLLAPFVTDYGRKTDALLSERQSQVAGLARSLAATAEQLGIAAASLDTIAESTTRSAKVIEGLPQRLQERMAEFTALLNEINASGNEALEQEIQTLRSAEGDRLVNAVDQLSSTARELGRIEAQTQAHASRIADAIALLPRLAEQVSGKAMESLTQGSLATRKEIETIFVQQRNALAVAVGTTQAEATRMLEAAMKRASAEFGANRDLTLGRLSAQVDTVQRTLDEKIAQLSRAVQRWEDTRTPTLPAPVSPLQDSTPSPASIVANADTPIHPTERQVNPEIDAPVPAASVPGTAKAIRIFSPDTGDRSAAVADDSPDSSADASVSAALFPKVVRGSDQPDEDEEDTALPGREAPLSAHPVRGSSSAPSPIEGRIEDDSSESFDDDMDDGEETMALTENGATRLLVTAYIGIGNKLFIRGNGAGLSWEKGVPLQFVSIGKWRWETTEAQLPLSARLYKNDQIECPSLGTFTLEPGRQRELSVTF